MGLTDLGFEALVPGFEALAVCERASGFEKSDSRDEQKNKASGKNNLDLSKMFQLDQKM